MTPAAAVTAAEGDTFSEGLAMVAAVIDGLRNVGAAALPLTQFGCALQLEMRDKV